MEREAERRFSWMLGECHRLLVTAVQEYSTGEASASHTVYHTPSGVLHLHFDCNPFSGSINRSSSSFSLKVCGVLVITNLLIDGVRTASGTTSYVAGGMAGDLSAGITGGVSTRAGVCL